MVRTGARPDKLVIRPMTEDFILWRCLHEGPLTRRNIDSPGPNPNVDWPVVRARNIRLVKKLTRTYGACAILAHGAGRVVGSLRFYPRMLCSSGDEGEGLCLLQLPPAGPAMRMSSRKFPPLRQLEDKALFVHCMMVAAPRDEPERFRRRGLATRMAGELVRWATQEGWEAIEACAYEELPLLYAISGAVGRRFWEGLGFRVIRKDKEPGITGELQKSLREDAIRVGLNPGCVNTRYRMRLELVKG
jgi:hypothetical protein